MAKEKSGALSISGLAIGVGVYWGLTLLVTGWTSIYGWGNSIVNVISPIYIGYEASFIGAIIGGIWGFAHGFVAGALVSYFYNKFRRD